MPNPREHVSIWIDTACEHNVAPALEGRERIVIVSAKRVVAPGERHIGNNRKANRRGGHQRSEWDRRKTTRRWLGSVYDPLMQGDGKGTANLGHGNGAVEILANAQARRLDMNTAATPVSCARDEVGANIVG